MNAKLAAEQAEWFRSRPPSIQRLMERIPMACLVRSKPPYAYVVPGEGKTAQVVGYTEAGEVMVVGGSFMMGEIQTYVDPDKVEFAGFADGAPVEELREAYRLAGLTWPALGDA